jgi:hypothetical protein
MASSAAHWVSFIMGKMIVSDVIQCGNCQQALPKRRWYQSKKRKPCPNCGSLLRHYSAAKTAVITPMGSMKFKAKDAKGRIFHRGLVKTSLFHLRGTLSRVERHFIRAPRDLYIERITDRKTGEVIKLRTCSTP